MMISSWYDKLTEHRHKTYISLFTPEGSRPILLACGCAEGNVSLKVTKKVNAKKVLGIDLDDIALSLAQKKGIRTIKSDLNSDFPLKDETVDIISSDQVIEHLTNVDNFMKEVYRVLKPEGYAVISTENLSAWHNVLAILLGKQAFAQHISSKWHLGNPFSPHYKKPMDSPFPHVHIFTTQGLKDLSEIYGFKVEKMRGIGYFPLFLSRYLEVVDPIHAYFLAIKIRKPKD